jgi:hypothetical protein
MEMRHGRRFLSGNGVADVVVVVVVVVVSL